jgi:type VI secretion system protein ImpF
MAELTQQERLQPSLLDRLTDDNPGSREESRDQRVFSVRRLREVVLRDLGWLMNTTNLQTHEDLSDYPEVARSVLNYGIGELAGLLSSSLDSIALEQKLRAAIRQFEPRILSHSLKVRVITASEQMNKHALTFEISGELWAQPIPLQLYLRTDVDLETGQVSVQGGADVPNASPSTLAGRSG